MRWLWRVLLLGMFLYIIKTLALPEPKTFIAWPEGQSWVEKINFEVKHWQRMSQDLPASLEVEVRQLFKDFHSNGNGEEV
ncbi:hypothetical protein REC12_20665 [Desulfosporosinus sp. PR]|uniref:hypothetical protein n=1 Tax=Candidatus Desulfosporosinus nitrosoreducens TaxID=3401928 RepID=UPI0027E63D55|nr:hypothetical protein [Desulfosporosinus sp. PR]MDQ7096012.1 hypothetical protein [Desulfosporosinus sp. PR]